MSTEVLLDPPVAVALLNEKLLEYKPAVAPLPLLVSPGATGKEHLLSKGAGLRAKKIIHTVLLSHYNRILNKKVVDNYLKKLYCTHTGSWSQTLSATKWLQYYYFCLICDPS